MAVLSHTVLTEMEQILPISANLIKKAVVLWAQRYYDSTRSDNHLWDAEQLPDGGFILAGQSFHIGHSQDGWLLRTDSNGCAPPICYVPVDTTHVGILQMNQSGIKLWPNPVSDILQLSWEENEFNSFSITNLQGQTVMEVKVAGECLFKYRCSQSSCRLLLTYCQ
jgi:hypothetical protein